MCDVCNNKGYIRLYEDENPEPRFFLTQCNEFNDSSMLRTEGATGFSHTITRAVGFPPRQQIEIVLIYERTKLSKLD